jgi:hypothetical protein
MKKNCVMQLTGFEPMPSCINRCIRNTKLQMQLMISHICVKVCEVWNSNAISENTNKVLVRARFQPDTFVICIWVTLNTVWPTVHGCELPFTPVPCCPSTAWFAPRPPAPSPTPCHHFSHHSIVSTHATCSYYKWKDNISIVKTLWSGTSSDRWSNFFFEVDSNWSVQLIE